MHDADTAAAAFEEALAGQAEDMVVFAQAGEKMGGLPFALQAEEVNKIGRPLEGLVECVESLHVVGAAGGDESCRGEDPDFHVQFARHRADRTEDARVQQVADQQNAATGQFTHGLAHGESVEQGLGGMRVVAVAGVDHGGRGMARDEGGHAGRGVAHDHVIDLHRLHGIDRVEDGLAFGHARLGDGQIGHVGRKAFGRDFEGGAGAGGRFEKKVEHRLAAQGGDFFDRAVEEVFERTCGVEEEDDFLGCEALDIEQVLAPGWCGGRAHGCAAGRVRKTPSRPSVSVKQTRTWS